MSWNFAQTLWDLIAPKRVERERSATSKYAGEMGAASEAVGGNGNVGAKAKHGGITKAARVSKGGAARVPMQQRYDQLVVEMKRRYGIRVRKWRKSSSGCAWEVRYSTGSIARLIEAPYPRGPMSCAIFLHEVGHHAIGFRTHKPRCLEEYYAWKWSLDMMRAYGLNVTPAVQKRMDDSLRYALAKAIRRGLRGVPAELVPYLDG